MSHSIKQIHAAFQDHPENSFLTIQASTEGYSFTASKQPDSASMDLFYEIFQGNQAKELCAKLGINSLSKRNVRQVFVNMAVFNEKGAPLAFSSVEEMQTLFLGKAPRVEDFLLDKAKTSGKGFKGLCEKVFLQWLHYFSSKKETDPIKAEIREVEFLASRMADREFQVGELIYLGENAFFRVDHVAAGNGAYVAVLRNLEDPAQAKIICRGTAMRKTATEGLESGLNDLHYEIGNGGVQASWPSIFNYLNENGIQEVEIYGKSLGGAHMQRFAILLMSRTLCSIRNLFTLGSVGAGPEAEALFNEILEQKPEHRQIPLRVIYNWNDYVPFMGGEHIGATTPYLDIKTYFISATQAPLIEDNLPFFKKWTKLFASFSGAHIEQTTLSQDFFFQEVRDRSAVQKILSRGKELEPYRRLIAWRNAISFTDFVRGVKPRDPLFSAEKVSFAVSGLFFVLCLAGFGACLIWQPGSIVYQGSGVILTLPAAILASCGALSLVAVAVSSYRWWSMSRRSAKALI